MKIGSVVPEMNLTVYHDNDIKNLKLSDFRGKWVVMFFYPADFTFVCPTELEELALRYEEFVNLGAEILSVSTDTVYVHKAWHDTSNAIKKIKFPMVADASGNICREFGTMIDEEGLSLRGSFIINPDGKLVAFEINDNSIGRSAKELLRKVQAAKFVYEADGEVCPAGWEPGQKTLKPSLELVGQI